MQHVIHILISIQYKSGKNALHEPIILKKFPVFVQPFDQFDWRNFHLLGRIICMFMSAC